MDWPFTGREEEIRTAQASLGGRPRRGVLIVGAAGVGKSRLALELIGDLGSRGYDTEWLRASSGAAAIPFGAISALVPAETPDTLWALFRLAHKALADRSRKGKPLVVGIDDVHQLDDASAALIHQATDKGIVLPVLTARTPEPVPEPIGQLWKDEFVDRMTLGELTRESTDRLLESALGVKATALVKNRAWELSLGNPLLLRELVLMGVGSMSERMALDPSDRLHEIVATRIGDVDPGERAVLETIAVSNTLELSLIEGHGGRDALRGLEDRQLVDVYPDGKRWMVQVGHPLHGEVLRAGLPPSRLRSISARLAEGLISTGLRRRTDIIRAATLHLDSGLPPDPDLMTRAAAAALSGFAHPVAERLARAAWSAGGHPSTLLVLGEALSRSERGEEADEVFARAERESEDPMTRTQAQVARSHNLAFVLGRVSEARELVERALSEGPTGPGAVALRVSGGWAAALGGSFREAIRLGGEVLTDDSADDELRLRALVISTLGQVMVGEVEAAQPHIDTGLELAERLRETMPFAADLLETNRFMGMTIMGRIDDAETLARARYGEAVAEGAPEAIGLWGADYGFAKERRGDYRAALRYLEEAAEISTRHDPYAIRGLALGWGAVAAAELGDRSKFAAFANALEEARAPEDFRTWTVAHRVEVWRHVLNGDDQEAAGVAARLGQLGVEKDFANWAVITVHEAVRLGHPHPVADLLAETARSVDGTMADTMSRHAQALIADDGDGLTAVATDFLAMGLDVYGMEALAQARQSHTRRGGRKEAARAQGRLVALRSEYPDAETPALRELPPLLTERENQVARLANSHTSPEIAEKLSISVRTVDNHLASVYSKLGVGGREALAEVLGLD